MNNWPIGGSRLDADRSHPISPILLLLQSVSARHGWGQNSTPIHALRPAGSLNRPGWLLSRGFGLQSPSRTARQLPDSSTIIRVEPPSTSSTRLRGARKPAPCGYRPRRCAAPHYCVWQGNARLSDAAIASPYCFFGHVGIVREETAQASEP